MPVQFDTAELRDAAQKILDAKARAQAEYCDAVEKARVEHRVMWLQRNMDNVKALRDYLTKCIRNSTPPTEKGMGEAMSRAACDTWGRPKNDSWQMPKFSEGNVVRPRAMAADQQNELPGLIELLDAHQDDLISPHQLANMGIKGRTVSRLFADLAVAKKTDEKKAS